MPCAGLKGIGVVCQQPWSMPPCGCEAKLLPAYPDENIPARLLLVELCKVADYSIRENRFSLWGGNPRNRSIIAAHWWLRLTIPRARTLKTHMDIINETFKQWRGNYKNIKNLIPFMISKNTVIRRSVKWWRRAQQSAVFFYEFSRLYYAKIAFYFFRWLHYCGCLCRCRMLDLPTLNCRNTRLFGLSSPLVR